MISGRPPSSPTPDSRAFQNISHRPILLPSRIPPEKLPCTRAYPPLVPPSHMAKETSLILFKPDAIEKNIVGPVLARFQAEGFQIRAMKMMRLDDVILRKHYAHTAPLPFFPDIVR